VRVSLGIAVLIVAATLAAVLPTGRRGSAADTEKTTIQFTVWGMPFEDRLFEDVYARGYEALHPHVAVDYQRYGSDLLLKYNAWHALGRGPEVMRVRITDYHGLVARGMLEPLDSYIDAPGSGLSPADLTDFPPHIMEHLRIGGRIYALPEDNAQFGLFYNKTVFDAHNRDHPDDPVTYPNANWTWEDLRDAARKLTRRDAAGRLTRRGIDFMVWSWPFMTLFAQAGGELWSPDGLTCTIATPPGVRALEFLRAMQREDRSFEPLFGAESGSGPDTLFAAGRTAMYLDGSWRVPDFEGKNPGLDFAVSPLPRGPRDGGVPAVVSGSVLWAISSNARTKDEAWRMIRWLVSPEQAAAYWDVLRVAPPARMSVLDSPAFRSTRGISGRGGAWIVPPMPEGRFADRAAWLLYANRPHPMIGRPPGFVPVNPYQTELEDEIQRMLEAYLNPTSTLAAQDALVRVARNMQALIDRDREARGLPPARR
jgi:multiple sugar transport system substrate-binding protein